MAADRATLESHVSLHELASRRDGAEWIVGRPDTGEFVGLPVEAMTFLGVLRDDGTVADAKRRTDLTHGEDIDALDFVSDLIGLGFVAAVDGERVAGDDPRPPSLPWLQPHHVSWLFQAPVMVTVAAFIGAGVTVCAVSGSFPGYSAFFALPEPGLSFVLAAVITMAIVALHEFCHLAAARAAGVLGWISLGTRLFFFLVAQTSVPGLWVASRGVRLRVFLAGMASDLTVFSACSVGMACSARAGVVHHVLALACLATLLGVIDQFLFFMRTDVYLVVQELTGCKNLFGDASDYLRYLAARWLRRSAPARPSPLAELPAREHRPVRLYAAVMVVGCASMLPVLAFYWIPIDIGIYVRGVEEFARGLSSSRIALVADAAGVLAVTMVYQALLVRALLRTYRPHLRRLLRPRQAELHVS
jgi:putative peptide zinc metalloprotease protein